MEDTDITNSNEITLEDRSKRINLFYHENHFDFISSVSAFFGTRGYCEKCETPYKCNYETHKCNNVCKVCCKRECQIDNQSYKCDWCKVKCRNFACLDYHQLYKCGKQKKCEICNRFKYQIIYVTVAIVIIAK